MTVKERDRFLILLMLMFFASLITLFFLEPEQQWYAFGHLILSWIGIMGLYIATWTGHIKA